MNIEELLKQRKDQLDIEDAPLDSWQHVQKELYQKSKKNDFSWWKVAAVIFLISSAALLTRNIFLEQEVEALASLGDLSSEYQKIEEDYKFLINELETNIDITEARSKKDYEWIFEELSALEEVNLLYRKDIGNVDESLLVGTLIDHYEKKIRLLKKLELEIKRNKNSEDYEKDNINHISI